jgi:cobalt/nickel transport system ATP-binding protein
VPTVEKWGNDVAISPKIENLHYTYEDGTPALNGIDLEIARGEFLAVLGSNGSGKTTLIKHLNGLLRPTLGRVLLDGKPVERVEDREVFSRIGIVFQDPNDQLFASTVEEDVAFGPTNMGLPPEEVKERVHKALHQVAMQEFARKSIHALSHGQKKRICVAGILAMEPQVIILDEPTAGLDPTCPFAHAPLEDLNRSRGSRRSWRPMWSTWFRSSEQDRHPEKGQVLRYGTPKRSLVIPKRWKGPSQPPLVAELMHILKTRDHVKLHHIPLTVGEARREILRLLSVQDVISRV